jgi:hypothetical protein
MIPNVEFLDFNNERIPIAVTLSVISKANIDFNEKYDKDLLQIILTDKPGAYYIEALTFLLKHAIIVGCERANVKLKKEWEKTDMLIDDYDIFLKFVEITVKSLTALTETNNDKKTTEKKMK